MAEKTCYFKEIAWHCAFSVMTRACRFVAGSAAVLSLALCQTVDARPTWQ